MKANVRDSLMGFVLDSPIPFIVTIMATLKAHPIISGLVLDNVSWIETEKAQFWINYVRSTRKVSL